MQDDIRLQYNQTLDESHHGHPTVVHLVHTGARGRPSIAIDPDFLRWAYTHRSTSAIGRFLGVSRRVVRDALIDHGIATPQTSPFVYYEDSGSTTPDSLQLESSSMQTGTSNLNQPWTGDLEDDILNHSFSIPQTLSVDIPESALPLAHIGSLSSDQLDDLILRLRRHYTRAGITMLEGMLRRLGYHVPREHIRQSLLRIDPVQRVFERIRIRRRTYSVPGPNSLWHHDGQHGIFYHYNMNYLLIAIYQGLFVGA